MSFYFITNLTTKTDGTQIIINRNLSFSHRGPTQNITQKNIHKIDLFNVAS